MESDGNYSGIFHNLLLCTANESIVNDAMRGQPTGIKLAAVKAAEEGGLFKMLNLVVPIGLVSQYLSEAPLFAQERRCEDLLVLLFHFLNVQIAPQELRG
jgi:hypothetical protein